jgi:hypothetical protein
MMINTQPDALPVAGAQNCPCRHLRSAGMYLYPDRSPEETAAHYDSSAYWCFHTMKAFGPNDDLVGGRECRDPERSCYQPI